MILMEWDDLDQALLCGGKNYALASEAEINENSFLAFDAC